MTENNESKRFAYVGTWMPQRRDFWPGPVDDDWILDQCEHHDFVIVLDQFSPGSERLRKAGLKVNISARREVNLFEDQVIHADEAQANLLLKEHQKHPFDAILYASDRPTDLAWFEPRLNSIPRGVALGPGLPQDLRLVWSDSVLFRRLAPLARHTAGFILSSDFLVSDVELSAFGFGDHEGFPPRLNTRRLPQPGALPSDPRWVVVSALSATRRELVNLVGRVTRRLPIGTHTNLIVLVNDASNVSEPLPALVHQQLDQNLSNQTIVVPVGIDDAAPSFLEQADLIVLNSASDLGVRGVGDACERLPFCYLEGHHPEPTKSFPPSRAASPPEPSTLLFRLDRPLREATRNLVRIIESETTEDYLLLYEPRHAQEAMHLLDCGPPRGVDLVFWGQPSPPFGEGNPALISPHAIAWSRRLRPTLPHALDQAHNLQHLIDLCADLVHTAEVTTLVLPSQQEDSNFFSPSCQSVPSLIWPSAPTFLPDPPPFVVEVPSGPSTQDVADRVWERSLVRWIRTHRWSDRLRLALPWKLGLLDRAMKGKWD